MSKANSNFDHLIRDKYGRKEIKGTYYAINQLTEVQWDSCDLSDCPPEREPGTISMVNHGKISSCPPEDLPKTFIDTDGNEHKIEDIHSLKSSTW